jgi:hypothetical protein
VPEPADPQSLNRYSYVNNRPLNFIDPSGHAAEYADSVGIDNEEYYWYWFYYNNPEVYYTDYWAAEEGQNIESLTRAYAYEQNVLHTSGTLDEPIVPAMIARYDAEIAKGNSADWLILLSCVGFVAGFDEDSVQYLDNSSRTWGMSARGGGGSSPPYTGSGPSSNIPTEGIYSFPDMANPGQTYVGQSGNVPRRLRQHVRAGRLSDVSAAEVRAVQGGRFVREIAEQNWINDLGGIRGGQVSNIRNPIGQSRISDALQYGLNCPRP